MKAGMSPVFQASTCAAIAFRIAASSVCACALAIAPALIQPDSSNVIARTRLIHSSEVRFPRSAYNGSMPAASETSPFRIVHTVCSHDCPDSCAVLVTVNEEGRAIKVQGDPAQPVTQGFLCGKVAKYLDRVYAPERIVYPLKRKAGVAKGPLARGRELESFERVSWDEALDGISVRLKETAGQYGPESILPYSYAGTMGVLGYGSMDRRFFHRLGASQLDRTICAEAGGVAWNLVYGKKLGT